MRINRSPCRVCPTGVKRVTSQTLWVTCPCPLVTYLYPIKTTHLHAQKVFLFLQNMSPINLNRSSREKKTNIEDSWSKCRGIPGSTLRFFWSQISYNFSTIYLQIYKRRISLGSENPFSPERIQCVQNTILRTLENSGLRNVSREERLLPRRLLGSPFPHFWGLSHDFYLVIL